MMIRIKPMIIINTIPIFIPLIIMILTTKTEIMTILITTPKPLMNVIVILVNRM